MNISIGSFQSEACVIENDSGAALELEPHEMLALLRVEGVSAAVALLNGHKHALARVSRVRVEAHVNFGFRTFAELEFWFRNPYTTLLLNECATYIE
jgi:hypothetical protein